MFYILTIYSYYNYCIPFLRFLQPIVMVKHVPEGARTEAYTKVHTTFQSTSSCNIQSVNDLADCSLYARSKQRGRTKHKRSWVVEMNQARELYLRSYFKVDVLDHLIKNTKLFYRSWKYWHAAMLHAKAMAIVTSFDMYKECAEGHLDLNGSWEMTGCWDFGSSVRNCPSRCWNMILSYVNIQGMSTCGLVQYQ